MSDSDSNPQSVVPLGESRVTTLAWVIEAVAGGRSRRDREFVRDLARWWDQHRQRLVIDWLERTGLEAALLTFHMRENVKLVISGEPQGHPGELTLGIYEADFPFVPIRVLEHPAPSVYSVCTLDYGRSGDPVVLTRDVRSGHNRWLAGTRGYAIVESTHGPERFVRVELDGESNPVMAPVDSVEFPRS